MRDVFLTDVFLTNVASGRQQAAMDILRGVNELHHTIANQFVKYAANPQGE
jgi:hypothetical protein